MTATFRMSTRRWFWPGMCLLLLCAGGFGPAQAAGRLIEQEVTFEQLTIVPDETGRYLLTRFSRDTHSLFRLLDELDQASLSAQRRLTIPFVRTVVTNSG